MVADETELTIAGLVRSEVGFAGPASERSRDEPHRPLACPIANSRPPRNSPGTFAKR